VNSHIINVVTSNIINAFPHLAVLMLSVISFISTYSGMQSLMTNLGDQGLGLFGFTPGVIVAFISILFTLTVQMMIVYQAMHLKGAGWSILRLHQNLGGKAWHISVYLTFIFLSVGFGYAFWFERIGADTYSKKYYKEQVYGSLKNLEQFRQAYTNFSNISSSLSTYSQNKAIEERQIGGTCGGPAKIGPGPRMRLRNRDANYFADEQPYFYEKKKTIDKLIGQLNNNLTVNLIDNVANLTTQQIGEMEHKLNNASSIANLLRTDPIKEKFINWLYRRIDEGKNGLIDTRTGEIFTCPDDRIEDARNKLKEINFPKLSENVKLFNPNNSKESVFLAFNRMGGFILSFLPLKIGETNRKLTLDEIIPLGAGILIDFLILIVAPPQERKKESLSFINKAFTGKPLLKKEVWDELKDTIELIWKYELRKGKRYYLVTPIDSKKDEQIKIREMIDLLLSNKWITLLGNVQKEKIEGWLSNHSDLLSYRKFAIYEMNPETYQELFIERKRWLNQEVLKERKKRGYRA
jgi:hypothetical protein